ncbi:MAG TPA: hypothetical protein DEP72_00635 [Clostridiales bacterium]|nr:MAG: hypothetical protein A2Y18_02945 [Clostridiales bacterium GWD2_32_19]HCC06658.1 hypothetical protein [Clostridiales bacterium]
MSILDTIKNKLKNDNTKEVEEKVEESTVFDELSYVEKLCQKSIQISKMQIKKNHTLDHYKETLKSIDIYEKVDDNTIKKIDKLMHEYAKLKQNKDNLKNHLLEYGKKYEHLSHYSYLDIDNEIVQIKKLEKEQIIIKKDMESLRSEKEEILQSSENAEQAYKIVRALFHFTIFAVSLVAIIFVILFSTMKENIIMPASITTVVVIFWSTWLYIFNNKLENDLVKYRKLQAREIQLSNKIKLKYVEITTLLDYKYKKFNTHSAETLKYDWDKYQETLDKKYQYNKVFHEFFDIEEQLQEVLTSKDIIFDEDISMIELISNIKEKITLKYELQHKINAIKDEIKIMDIEQLKIKESLNQMEREDKTDQKLIRTIISSYFKELDELTQ